VAGKLVFSYLGNPGVGSLHCVRRAVEKGYPRPIELEEYSHFGMVGRYMAGASNLPFFPLRSYAGSDLPQANALIRFVDSPYGDDPIAVVPPLKPDVTIVHAQRADSMGNTQFWGLLGVQKEAAFAASKVVVVVEEIVDESVIRHDPNRTLIPGLIVDAVVCEPYGAHPSYVQGYYDRDNAFYLAWDQISRDPDKVEQWLQEWVHDVPDRASYLEKLGADRLASLRPGEMIAGPVNYGRYA
jgi:glutaconate CoA-transferase subunit A